jgi:hypothetical protein
VRAAGTVVVSISAVDSMTAADEDDTVEDGVGCSGTAILSFP